MHHHSNSTGPRKQGEEKKSEKIFEEIIVKKFPNMGKEIVTQVQEVQRDPHRRNPRRNTLRHMLTKLGKLNTKKNIKNSNGKAMNNI